MTFGESVKKCFRDCLDFEVRAPRSEYWWFFLFTLAGTTAAGFADGDAFGWDDGSVSFFEQAFWLATLLPGLAAGVRRLHDTNRRGWWLLLCLPLFVFEVLPSDDFGHPSSQVGGYVVLSLIVLSLVCILLLLYLLTRKGTDGDNRFGSNPLGGGRVAPAIS